MSSAATPNTLPLAPTQNTSPQETSDTRFQQALSCVVREVGAAHTSEEALQALYGVLHTYLGVEALALELVRGATYYQSCGEAEALAAAAAHSGVPHRLLENRWQVHICPLECKFGPRGQITFVLRPDSPATQEQLATAITPLAMLLDQERLIQRVEESEKRAQRRISEVAAIYEIGQAIDQIDLKQLLQLITDRAALLMDAQACSLMLVHEETGTLRVAASHGLPENALEHEQRIGEGIAGRVAQADQPMLILDATRDPRLEGVRLRPEIGSSMLVPMKNQEGRVLGVLSIRRRRPAPDFTDDDLKLFSVFATQAALALTNVRLYADLKRSASELQTISELSSVLISTLDLDELLSHVADDICNGVGFGRCCLYMVEGRDLHRAAYVPRVWRGYPDTIPQPVRDGEGAVGTAARNKEIIVFDARQPVSPERARERDYLQHKGFARSLGTQAFIIVPILTSQKRCLGVVVADNKGRRDPISREQQSLLCAFVNQAGIAIENARLHTEVQERKSYTDSVLHSIGAGIVSTDAQGRITRHNPAAEETLRQPAAAFRDASIADLITQMGLPDTEREHLLRMIWRVIETGERIHLHKLMLHPQGREPMALNLTMSRLMDHNAGAVLSFEDMTQEVRLEAEVEKMRRLADIGQLAAKMAHEVRNALTPMKGSAQLIRAEMEAQSSSTEMADIIIKEVDDLERLTSEMLDFARPTLLDPRPLAVLEFLTGAVQSLAAFLDENRVEVHWNVTEGLPELLGDPILLGQVVRNIVMNAVQAMPEGGSLTLSAEYDPDTNLLAIRFRDTGVGIPRADLKRIFQPFFTTKTKGTGLGLSIVQKIVDYHGGRVDVDSRVGFGTCFSILLPLRPPHDGADLTIEELPIISAKPAGPFPDK
ncbi:MAG TPA: GAF domain-containing protein [Chthonomonadaceae bacterium]|nr:GAF domain-containing protein [Chthonomonadaceae bacterium]